MSRLCRFGRAVISTIEYYIDGDDFSISDEWKLYGEIENLFRQAGWLDDGEVDDLLEQIKKLEVEFGNL